MKNIKTIIGLLLFLGYPFLLRLFPIDLFLHEVAMWLLLPLILLWIYLVEKRKIGSIGLKNISVKMIFGGIGLGLVLFIIFGISTVGIQTIGLELNQDMAKLIVSQSIPFLILLSIRAAIVEEIVFRGFAFERITELTNSKLLAIILPLIVFTLAHISWGVGHLVFVFIAGGLFAIIYSVTRNLALVIIAHFVTDIVAIVVLPLLAGVK